MLRAAAAYPLLTVKVVAGIRWEALLLWLKGLHVLDCSGCRISSLEPLTETALEELHVDFNWNRDLLVLQRIPRLKKINGVEAKEFLRVPR